MVVMHTRAATAKKNSGNTFATPATMELSFSNET